MAAPRLVIVNAQHVQEALRLGSQELLHPKTSLRRIRDDMYRVVRATFTGQGRRYGGSWHHLSKARVREKARRGLDPRILIASEKLMNSLTKPRSRNQYLSITDTSLEIASTLSYADTHQFGDPDRGIPARPFIDFDYRDVDRWIRIMHEDLGRRMNLAGRKGRR